MPKTAAPMPGGTAFKSGSVSQFLKEVWTEISQKTTWPTRPELIRSTSVVLAAILAVSFYLAGWDYLLAKIVAGLYNVS